MSTALQSQLLVMIYDAPMKRLDHAVSRVWSGHAAGHINDDEANYLANAADHRRIVLRARNASNSHKKWLPHVRKPIDRGSPMYNRRVWSASGALPAHLRSHFTPGENAVAAVVLAEVRKHGCCSIPYSKIAECAGLRSPTVVKRFVRQARMLKLINVAERPVEGDRNKPNVIRIVSKEWLHWCDYGGRRVGSREGGGGTNVPPIQNQEDNRYAVRPSPNQKQQRSAPGRPCNGLMKGDKLQKREPTKRLLSGSNRTSSQELSLFNCSRLSSTEQSEPPHPRSHSMSDCLCPSEYRGENPLDSRDPPRSPWASQHTRQLERFRKLGGNE